MLAEFVKSIASMATSRRAVEVVKLPGHQYMVVDPDGKSAVHPDPRPDIFDQAHSLDAFMRLVDHHATALDTTDIMVFVQPVMGVVLVTAVFDTNSRRDSVTLRIGPSSSLCALRSLGAWASHKDFVSAVRDQLFDCVEGDLLNKLRSIDFKRRNDGNRSIEHGRESLGKSVEMAVQSRAGELPEFTEIEIPWFSSLDFVVYQRLTLCIDTDAVNERLRLVPRGDTMDHASFHSMQAVVKTIEQRIAEMGDEIPVIEGTPSAAE